ncbi:MAG TPA: hypothetical protein VF210_20935 [Pseudomonadales bacterium]
MRRILRLVVAFVVGFAVGSLVNMGLVLIGGSVIPPPAGADTTTMEGLKASLHLFEPRHFLFPFLAHSLGTLFGAAVAALMTPGRTPGPAYAVGAAFLLGGITNVLMLPAPVWFNVLDLVLAYLPAAWLGHRAVSRWAPDAAADGVFPETKAVTDGSGTHPAPD